jgi:CheY-like chemotaxis protein
MARVYNTPDGAGLQHSCDIATQSADVIDEGGLSAHIADDQFEEPAAKTPLRRRRHGRTAALSREPYLRRAVVKFDPTIRSQPATLPLMSPVQARPGKLDAKAVHPDQTAIRTVWSTSMRSAQPVILIVEDDTLLRMDAVAMIKAEGYQTIEATNADDAIMLLESRADIAVIFTDVQMPGSMDGLKLAAAVKDRWPPVKIIATSGLGTVGVSDLPEGGRFIPKPYTGSQISTAIREFLRESGTGT